MSNNVQHIPNQCKLIESSSFHEFIHSLGHAFSKTLQWGRWHRQDCSVHPNNKDGVSYRIFSGTLANGNTDWGHFTCFRCQIKTVYWSSKDKSQRTPEQDAYLQKQIEKERHQMEKKREIAQKNLEKTWENGKSADVNSYIKRKHIIPYGVKDLRGTLLIPMYDKCKSVINIEHVYYDEDNKKRIFRITGAPSNGFGIISEPKTDLEIIYLGEGFATMATVHEATGNPCFFSFGAGNLKKVYDMLKSIYINKIVIIADNNEDHTGEQAASRVCQYILCPFPKDFNDLFVDQLINKGLSRMKALAVVKDSIKQKTMNSIKFPHLGDKGKPCPTLENTSLLLSSYGITLKYNEMKYRREITIPNITFNPTGMLNDQLTYISSLAARYCMSTGHLDSHLNLIARENSYHPIVQLLDRTVWDGVSRIKDFMDTLTVVPEQEELKVIVLQKWLMQGVKSIRSTSGYANQIVLMLLGSQGLGKTSWCRQFFSTIDPEASMTDFSLDPRDKDDIMRFYEYAFIELGEAELTINKRTMAGIKRILTAPVSQERKAFDRCDSMRFRRSFIAATVNQEKCLVDDTGNRRFAPLEVTHIDYTYSSHIDMPQLLAEVDFLLKSGELESFTTNEMAMINASNKQFEMEDPMKEMILERFYFEAYTSGFCQTIPMTIT